MATNVYEGMFILDSNRYGRNPESVVGQIPKMIEEIGGELLVSRLWEERRLAYPIQGHRKGTYWLTYFRAPGGEVAGLERKCQLSETILRVLFLKVDSRIVDTLIAHAQAGPTSSAPPAEKEKKHHDDVEEIDDEVEVEVLDDEEVDD
ncbi:MAG: 30S ribosomal protein S6 [Pirellulales bacterium]|nr:30S ribosomal protein S6 [Pirellulales bacterium]